MVKDKRHKTVKILIEGGHITEFSQIFDHIPKTVVADQLGIHFNRMNTMINGVENIKAGDIFLIGSYFDIEAKKMFELINNQYLADKKSKKKR